MYSLLTCLLAFTAISYGIPEAQLTAKRDEIANQEKDLKELADKASKATVGIQLDSSEVPKDTEVTTQSKNDKVEKDNSTEQKEKVVWMRAVSPKVVAQYLLRTGDLDGFIHALQELITDKKVNMEEAEEYEQKVALGYKEMLAQNTERPTQTSRATTTEVTTKQALSDSSIGLKLKLEEKQAYVKAMTATLRRLYYQATHDGNKDAQTTISEFFGYLGQLAEKGVFKGTEIRKILDMFVAATEQQTDA